ncbi:glutathione peroxidase [Paenibacillus psychroresistens]|uniref:Glutathione peroxidase n=1 Tax=Paenibacillus psychroresistens TaxID=1778678 RepID=A0A6B8RJ93_9BACL|nr:glutathione peroxidase [Paenibacillus psychroresistens]QGQ95804.1 glutathione peroxidase [Paenibacillus psychroresistens]
MSIYDFKANTIRGTEASLADYEGKVILIVNTASKCGFTPQYTELQKLYEQFKDQGLVVLGFPSNQFGGQEPGTNDEVDSFCQINYGVTFPLFEKIEVKDEHKHPLFAYLTEEAPFKGFDQESPRGKMMHDMFTGKMPEQLETDEIKWNFTKFLIDRKGHVVQRFESPIEPQDIAPAIEAVL